MFLKSYIKCRKSEINGRFPLLLLVGTSPNVVNVRDYRVDELVADLLLYPNILRYNTTHNVAYMTILLYYFNISILLKSVPSDHRTLVNYELNEISLKLVYPARVSVDSGTRRMLSRTRR